MVLVIPALLVIPVIAVLVVVAVAAPQMVRVMAARGNLGRVLAVIPARLMVTALRALLQQVLVTTLPQVMVEQVVMAEQGVVAVTQEHPEVLVAKTHVHTHVKVTEVRAVIPEAVREMRPIRVPAQGRTEVMAVPVVVEYPAVMVFAPTTVIPETAVSRVLLMALLTVVVEVVEIQGGTPQYMVLMGAAAVAVVVALVLEAVGVMVVAPATPEVQLHITV